MKFTINLAFWEMFKKRSPNSASNIQPQYTEMMQTFSVDLYHSQIRKLDQPVDLENFLETMGTDGQRMPTIEEREASQPMQNIMPRWLNNVLVMTCTAVTTVLMIVILILLAKHFKMMIMVLKIGGAEIGKEGTVEMVGGEGALVVKGGAVVIEAAWNIMVK